jgi:hypothetical protein
MHLLNLISMAWPICPTYNLPYLHTWDIVHNWTQRPSSSFTDLKQWVFFFVVICIVLRLNLTTSLLILLEVFGKVAAVVGFSYCESDFIPGFRAW